MIIEPRVDSFKPQRSVWEIVQINTNLGYFELFIEEKNNTKYQMKAYLCKPAAVQELSIVVFKIVNWTCLLERRTFHFSSERLLYAHLFILNGLNSYNPVKWTTLKTHTMNKKGYRNYVNVDNLK